MPALFFPNPDALRLVLASGVLPAGVTAAPARAGWDAQGRLWLEPASPVPRDALAGLGRFGVQALGGGEATPEQVGSWAELLALRPAPPVPAGRVLFELPDHLLGSFTRSLHRRGPRPVGVRLLPGDDRRTWVTCPSPPPDLFGRTVDPDSAVEPFTEQAPGVWVRVGWEHPFPEGFTLPPGHVILLRPPRSVIFHAGLPPAPALPDFPTRVRGRPHAAEPPPPAVTVRVTLVRTGHTPGAELWVFPPDRAEEFWAVCRTAGERALSGYEAAQGAGGVVVRRAKPDAASLPFGSAGFYPDARTEGLFLPCGQTLRPALRPSELTRRLGLSAAHRTWVEAEPSGTLRTVAVPREAFRPLAAVVEHTAAPPVRLAAPVERQAVFPLAPFELEPDHEATPLASEETAPAVTTSTGRAPVPDVPPPRRGWLARSLALFARRGDEAAPESTPAKGRSAKPAARPPELRASADALLHGADRTARRQELEARLIRDFRRLGPADRAAGWAELAAVYAATGNPADAAVCWANAVWEADPPPADWLDQWYAAECRAARRAAAEPLDRWLAEPGRFGAARVVAAFTARAALSPQPPADLPPVLTRVLALLDQQFDDLPARSAWLARVAAARLTGGDTLGLASWRDRIVARLREKGPGLDLDEPSFLRFHGTASPERFQTARDWLARVKKPVLDWVARLGPTGRLQAVGMDAETECTAAYAQLMLAWGLACLGERGRALDWSARARKILSRAAGPGVDPEVHGVLSALFAARIRDVQDGRAPRAGVPAEFLPRYEGLAPLSRYAVDRLRDHSRILEPVREGLAFRGLDLRLLRGSDQLGERLQLLADGTDPAVTRAEGAALLEVCDADPCSATVPRVTLTLLDAAGRLDGEVVAAALGHVVPAASWLDTWLQAGRWTTAERADRLPKYLGRLFAAAATAAARFGLAAEVRPLAEFLARRVGPDAAVRAAVVRAAGPVFRGFRKLGLGAEVAGVLDRLDPDRGDWPAGSPLPPARLGLAVGWYAAGDEDAGNRLLDDARARLFFMAREGDDRDRTELAIGYADALGFAPPRVALGRLEELFQLLDRVTTTGSTNRYYTLKPLELIDTVVRAVVTDDFALGPAVRDCLADDEFLIRRRIHRDLDAALRGEGDGG
jgi:hypothetical protein